MSDAPEVVNAVIESASIFFEDHGFLTIFVYLNYGGSGQGFGGYAFGTHSKPDGGQCGEFIRRTMQAAGVERWEDLPGKTVRVRHNWERVHSIGHIIDDKHWFTPADVFRDWPEAPTDGE